MKLDEIKAELDNEETPVKKWLDEMGLDEAETGEFVVEQAHRVLVTGLGRGSTIHEIIGVGILAGLIMGHLVTRQEST